MYIPYPDLCNYMPRVFKYTVRFARARSGARRGISSEILQNGAPTAADALSMTYNRPHVKRDLMRIYFAV